MDNKILVQCSDLDTTAILKAAMVNAIARLERCGSRRERQELRHFILDCAGILSKDLGRSLNPDSVPKDSRQENWLPSIRD